MPTPHFASGRLPKFIPQPEQYAARYGGFAVTQRDYQILDLVYRYRHLEARHIRSLISGSDQQITRRLQGLFHNRYLRRYFPRNRMRIDLDPGTPLTAYGLDLRGARTLTADFTDSEREPVRWKKAYTPRTEWFLVHRLAVSHVRCVLELAARQSPGIELLDWMDGDSVTLNAGGKGSASRRRRLVPDARFAIREAGARRNFFLEVDRSTEEHRRLTEKFEGYWRYLDDLTKRETFNARRLNVLFVTTTETRLNNMMNTLRKMRKSGRAGHAGRGLFLFAAMESFVIERPTVCVGPVWRKASQAAVPQRLVETTAAR